MFEYLDKVYIKDNSFTSYVVIGTNDHSYLDTLISPTGHAANSFWVSSKDLTLIEEWLYVV